MQYNGNGKLLTDKLRGCKMEKKYMRILSSEKANTGPVPLGLKI